MDKFQVAESIALETLDRFYDKPTIFHIEYMKAKLELLGFSRPEIEEAAAWTNLKYF